jgi:rubredoxin
MASYDCPRCGLIAHTAPDFTDAIPCPRCHALHQQVEMTPRDDRSGRSAPHESAPAWASDSTLIRTRRPRLSLRG